MSIYHINLDKEYTERFDMGKFMAFDSGEYDPLTSSLITELDSMPLDNYFTVSSEIGRPDTISYKIYGDVQYWWIILLYNDIYDAQELVSGTILKYPVQSALDNFYFSSKQKGIM